MNNPGHPPAFSIPVCTVHSNGPHPQNSEARVGAGATRPSDVDNGSGTVMIRVRPSIHVIWARVRACASRSHSYTAWSSAYHPAFHDGAYGCRFLCGGLHQTTLGKQKGLEGGGRTCASRDASHAHPGAVSTVRARIHTAASPQKVHMITAHEFKGLRRGKEGIEERK